MRECTQYGGDKLVLHGNAILTELVRREFTKHASYEGIIYEQIRISLSAFGTEIVLMKEILS